MLGAALTEIERGVADALLPFASVTVSAAVYVPAMSGTNVGESALELDSTDLLPAGAVSVHAWLNAPVPPLVFDER